MTLKSRIHTEYVSAFKNRETVKKNILSVLRGEITTIEKNTGTPDLSDAEITKLLLKYKKNLEETRVLADNPSLAEEQAVIESFLPAQMAEGEIRTEITTILSGLPAGLPQNARSGKAMGEFNKRFPGAADPRLVMTIINSIA
jgi:uncharacterized protein YqeY